MILKNASFYLFLLITMALLTPTTGVAQDKEVLLSADSNKTVTAVIDTTKDKKPKIRMYSPKKAATRSAMIPGWGQAYNKKYWKIPIVYGALGTTAAVFAYNLKWYKRTRYAFTAVADTSPRVYPNVDPELQFLVDRNDGNTLSYLRDSYRRDIDYSVLIFALLWGLNVIDAAVDSHLKSFDVSPDLSLRFNPGYSNMARTTGLSVIMDIGKRKPAMLTSKF